MQIDSNQYIDVVMSAQYLIEHSDNYLKTSGMLWHFCRDVLAVDNDDGVTDFTEANATTDSFNLKEKLKGLTENNGTKNAAIMVPLKYLSHFWKTLEMPSISCKIALDLNRSGKKL